MKNPMQEFVDGVLEQHGIRSVSAFESRRDIWGDSFYSVRLHLNDLVNCDYDVLEDRFRAAGWRVRLTENNLLNLKAI